MDAESEEFGGVHKFFSGEFARYGWAKLMRSGLGGHETLNLYAEAIAQMPENPGIPLLFRNIFKNAYLSYRNPEALKVFLKVIDELQALVAANRELISRFEQKTQATLARVWREEEPVAPEA